MPLDLVTYAMMSLSERMYVCILLLADRVFFVFFGWFVFFQELRIHALQTRVGASEQALVALEQTATEQMEGLTQQSSHAMEKLQRQLGTAYSQLEQLRSFIKVLYNRCTESKARGPV